VSSDLDDILSKYADKLVPDLLDEEDGLVMPNLSEILDLLKLRESLDLKELVKTYSGHYSEFLAKTQIKKAPSEFVGFVIPLDSFLPLPNPYGAHTVYINPDNNNEVLTTSMAMVTNVVVRITLGDATVKVKLSVIIACLGTLERTTRTFDQMESDIKGYYTDAIRIANDVITAYKLTPGRHNHNLGYVTLSNRPSNVEALRFNAKSGKILQQERFAFHETLLASILHSRIMTDDEINNFRRIHLDASGGKDSFTPQLISKIYRAIDEGCNGHFDQSIVLADTYAEHFLRYILSQLLLIKLEFEQVEQKLSEIRSLNKLLTSIARELNMTHSQLRDSIDFTDWNAKCRSIRNGLTHRVLNPDVTPEESREAIRSTVMLTTKLAALIAETYPLAKEDMQKFKTIEWYNEQAEFEEEAAD